MLKKLMLLAMAVGVVVALSAPAASADEWWTVTTLAEDVEEHTLPIGTASAEEVTFAGEVSSTIGPLRNGPCKVHAIIELWNEEFPEVVTGTGEVTTVHITTPCQIFTEAPSGSGNYLPIPGCEVEEAFANTENPWHIDVLQETGLDIAGANFVNLNSAGCAPFFPPAVGASGTATGEGVNRANKFCIELNDAGNMETPTGVKITLDGEVCADDLTLK